eukprot:1445468-Amphidinium_carterae.1
MGHETQYPLATARLCEKNIWNPDLEGTTGTIGSSFFRTFLGTEESSFCLLYTSDAADDTPC